MKTLDKIVMHGATHKPNGMRFSGFTMLHFTDGTTKYLSECGSDAALEQAEAMGVNCADFKRRAQEWQKEHSYPPIPEAAELYQHNWGYEKPVELLEWQWSTTFGRWGRLVRFADGWKGYTFPKT